MSVSVPIKFYLSTFKFGFHILFTCQKIFSNIFLWFGNVKTTTGSWAVWKQAVGPSLLNPNLYLTWLSFTMILSGIFASYFLQVLEEYTENTSLRDHCFHGYTHNGSLPSRFSVGRLAGTIRPSLANSRYSFVEKCQSTLEEAVKRASAIMLILASTKFGFLTPQ